MTYRMLRFALSARVLLVACCVAGIVVLNGCGSGDGSADSGKQKYEVAQESEDTSEGPGALPPLPGGASPQFNSPGMPAGGAPRQPPSTPPSGLNPYKVQGETPEELMAFIESMFQSARQPRGATQAEQMSNLQNMLTAVISAADKILGQEADAKTLRMANEAKVACLTQLAAAGVGDAQERLVAFCQELKQSDDTELVQLGERMEFAFNMDKFAQGESDDAAALVASFKELFANATKDGRTVQFASSVIDLFAQRGFKAEAADIRETVAVGFDGVTDPEVAAAVAQLKERALMADLELSSKLNAYMMGQEGALQPLLESLNALLQSEARGVTKMSAAQQIAMYLEQQDPDKAGDLYVQIAEAFKDDPDLAEQAKSASERYVKRSAIVGKPFVVEGANLDGSPFDWSTYAGKVVLVDFWATWCRPCIDEIPRIKANYDRYRDQGFEVVGVNLDEERSQLDQFQAIQPLPWRTIVSADANAVGLATPLAAKCGVEAIPFLVLVDRDGTAIALNLRGDQLSDKLAELFPREAEALEDDKVRG